MIRLKARGLRLALAAALALSVTAATELNPPPATAATTLCTNSGCPEWADWSVAMYQGGTGGYCWWQASCGHNCTNYVAWRLSRAGIPNFVDPSISAHGWDDRAISKGYVVDGTPAVGAIAHWNAGEGRGDLGHVAIVEKVEGNTITIAQDSWPNGPYSLATLSLSEIPRFLHVGVVPPSQTPPPASELAAAEWRLNNQNDASPADLSFTHGLPGDIPVVGDWDGDGIQTEGVVRNGVWILTNEQQGGTAFASFIFGNGSDTPLVGDWDGDGIDTPGLHRGDEWILRAGFTNGTNSSYRYGRPSDIGIVGDWDGDGVDSFGVVRDNVWILTNTRSSQDAYPSFVFGKPNDQPLVGDWNGDGIDTIGVKREDEWILTNTWSSADKWSFFYGRSSDIPLVGDWDGDHAQTIGVAR